LRDLYHEQYLQISSELAYSQLMSGVLSDASALIEESCDVEIVGTNLYTECQQRGEEHGHQVLLISGEISIETIDACVSALLPPEGTAARRFTDAHLIHDHKDKETLQRCAVPDKDGWHCKYGFPFAERRVTLVRDNGRILLRRREQDSMVVQTNPELALETNLHIEQEFVSRLTPGVFTYVSSY
jgi:hypothetical protein